MRKSGWFRNTGLKRLLFFLFAAVVILAGLYAAGVVNFREPPPAIVRDADNIPAMLTQARAEGLAPDSYIEALVARIVDGDTVIIKYRQKDYRARLLDIDTPESVMAGVIVQPYAKEAMKFTRTLIQNQVVRLIFEENLRDKYNRLLAHVILKNGKYLNALLVRNGFARVEILPPNNVLSDYFYNIQDKAIQDKAGFWGLPENKRPFAKNAYGEYVPEYWLKQAS